MEIKMKRILVMLTLVLALIPLGGLASADIYDEIEAMLEQEREAQAEQEETGPVEYLAHSPMFFEPVECTGINVYNESLSIHLGDGTGLELDVKPMPVNTTEKELKFSSSNTSIITVSQDGVVTPVGIPGDAVVTVTCGDASEDIAISVIRGAEGVSLSRSDMLFYIDQPITAQLTASVYPADATNKNVTWSSENTAVAAVDENGIVTPIGTGTTNIVATTEDGGFTAKCIVYVQIYNIPVRGAFITNAIEAMRINSDYALTSYIYPQNARDKTVAWYSSNPEVVTVDANGNLHAVSEGMSVITLRASNGVEDTFTISCVPDDGTPFEYKYISKSVEERIAELSMPVTYTHYNTSFSSALNAQMGASPTVFTTNASAASRSDVERYLEPSNFPTGYAKYQFLDLSVSNGISAASLNNYLKGKGVLEGKGETFIDAARANGISEIYLAVHSVLESGNGSSQLASGVEYNGTTVYNLFGIGAYDEDPINGGAQYAYEQGWTSVDAAINGGAEWISSNYINNGQNTLYEMKWNPENPATHQYATDVAWAVKQARTIKSLVEASGGTVSFDVPIYSDRQEFAISWD